MVRIFGNSSEYCKKAVAFCKLNKIPYEYRDYGNYGNDGIFCTKTVLNITIDDIYVGGYEAMKNYLTYEF
jgi:hypothetical protein